MISYTAIFERLVVKAARTLFMCLWLSSYLHPACCQSALAKGRLKSAGTSSNKPICKALPGDFNIDFNACNQHQVDFTNNARTTAVSWDFGDGTNGNANDSISHVYRAEGIYSVTLVAKNKKGCLDTAVKEFIISIDTGNIFSSREVFVCRAAPSHLPGDSATAKSFWSPPKYLDSTDIDNPLCTPDSNVRYTYNIVKKGPNLANNGHFNRGNIGFSSKYIYDSIVNGPGHYFISADPQLWNPLYQKCSLDTFDITDSMLIVSGSIESNFFVWSSKMSVNPNTNYVFSFHARSLTTTDLLTLQVSINDGEVIGRITLPDTPCVTRKFITSWFSDTATTVIIRITDLNTNSANNNFAIDDIIFRPLFLKTDSLLVSMRPPPVFSVRPSTAVICPGDSVLLTASGGNKYSWYPSVTVTQQSAANTSVFPTSNTTYKIIITENTCHITDSIFATVFVRSKPTVTVSKSNDVTCTVTRSTLNATGGIGYHWRPDNTLSNLYIANPIAMPYKTTTYLVQVSDANGCKAEDSMEVKVTNADDSNAFLLPNAFTPNKDGLNDRFGIHEWGSMKDLQFSIYNRWGKLIFYSSDAQKSWDGTYHGTLQPLDTYVYMVKGTTICGYVARKGTVVLLR